MSDGEATQAFYDRWARLYDLLATAPGIRSWRTRAVDALDLAPGETVVEMGVGTGANIPYLREAVGNRGRVIGIDVTQGMLEVARRRATSQGWDNVHLVRADATRPPLTGPVDAVLSSFVVGMLENPVASIEDWATFVAGNGTIALLDAARSNRPLARPLNLCLRAFVRLTAPGKRGGDEPPIEILESRLADAQNALAAVTTAHHERRFAGGFVRVRWGRLGKGD
jgi:ubiquinone/menaquinone biosynthesis C-methylase UbiE